MISELSESQRKVYEICVAFYCLWLKEWHGAGHWSFQLTQLQILSMGMPFGLHQEKKQPILVVNQ